ncbi:MAG: dTMP kinase [Magnetococcales bacterium]|nr:dTMP kinase [Magnetococcales bacterium]
MEPRGRFITFEGGEGAGKSTQVGLLVAWLRAQALPVLATHEPGGSPLAHGIRSLLLAENSGEAMLPVTELCLILAARAQHVTTTIRPALGRGVWVVCDRFSDSTLAYQGAGRGLDSERIAWLGELVTGGLLPDLTLLLDIPTEVGLERCRQRHATLTRFDREELAFHRRVREGFLRLAEREPRRVRVIDATQPPATVAQRIQEELAHVRARV